MSGTVSIATAIYASALVQMMIPLLRLPWLTLYQCITTILRKIDWVGDRGRHLYNELTVHGKHEGITAGIAEVQTLAIPD
jgi:hypothetical protein